MSESDNRDLSPLIVLILLVTFITLILSDNSDILTNVYVLFFCAMGVPVTEDVLTDGELYSLLT